MELTHRFTVPASVEETWAAFENIEGVAECFPGAQVTSVEGDTFKGTVKVKLGPIALVYNGSGEFVEKDQSAGRMVIAAKGKDKRGNGTAGADVVATMTGVEGGTEVQVVTDLNITGKPAQFGRGVIQDVSDKLLGQFVDCLERKVGAPEAAATDTGETTSDGGDQDTEPASVPAGAAAGPASGTASGTADADAGPASVPAGAAAPAGATAATSGSASSAGSSAGSSGGSSGGSDDALDLGATVLPVLVKSYGKQAAAGLGVLLVLLWLLRRRR